MISKIKSNFFLILCKISQFTPLNQPKSRISYQGYLSVSFRDFLIDQPELKSFIKETMDKNGISPDNEDKSRKVYDFIDKFYNQNGRGPTSLELYQKFLNFKSYELRGKINTVRRNHPHYYS
jgi:hypothetical protein